MMRSCVHHDGLVSTEISRGPSNAIENAVGFPFPSTFTEQIPLNRSRLPALSEGHESSCKASRSTTALKTTALSSRIRVCPLVSGLSAFSQPSIWIRSAS